MCNKNTVICNISHFFLSEKCLFPVIIISRGWLVKQFMKIAKSAPEFTVIPWIKEIRLAGQNGAPRAGDDRYDFLFYHTNLTMEKGPAE